MSGYTVDAMGVDGRRKRVRTGGVGNGEERGERQFSMGLHKDAVGLTGENGPPVTSKFKFKFKLLKRTLLRISHQPRIPFNPTVSERLAFAQTTNQTPCKKWARRPPCYFSLDFCPTREYDGVQSKYPYVRRNS